MVFLQTKEAEFKKLSPARALYGLRAGILSGLALITPAGATAKKVTDSPTVSILAVAPGRPYRPFPTRLVLSAQERTPAVLPAEAPPPGAADSGLRDTLAQLLALGPDLRLLVNSPVRDMRSGRIALGLRYAQTF